MHLFLLCLILFAGGWTLLAVASQEFKGHNIVQIVLGIICGIGYGALCIYTLKFRAAETSAIADYQFWFCLAFLMAFTFIDIIWLIRGRKMSCGNFFVLYSSASDEIFSPTSL